MNIGTKKVINPNAAAKSIGSRFIVGSISAAGVLFIFTINN